MGLLDVRRGLEFLLGGREWFEVERLEGHRGSPGRSGICFVVLSGCRTWFGSPKGVRRDLGSPWMLTYSLNPLWMLGCDLGALSDGVWSGVHLNVGV